MKGVLFFLSLLAVTFAKDNSVCYNTFVTYCKPVHVTPVDPTMHCNASYGGAQTLMNDLRRFANAQIALSFDYLLMSTNFGSYEKNRKGLEKLFRQLSDSAWENGIDLMKYISKRGGSMDFDMEYNDTAYVQPIVQLNEIKGLARALDNHKILAGLTFELHRQANTIENRDPEVSSYLENTFLHKQADDIRSLSGHVHDLKQMLSYPEQKSVSLFIFDEYLKSH